MKDDRNSECGCSCCGKSSREVLLGHGVDFGFQCFLITKIVVLNWTKFLV